MEALLMHISPLYQSRFHARLVQGLLALDEGSGEEEED